MGFFVQDELTFPRFNITKTNCYVSVKATFFQHKQEAPIAGMYVPTMYETAEPPAIQRIYNITAKFYVYASAAAGLEPLQEQLVALSLDECPANPLEVVYNFVKEQHFAGKTFTDDA